MSLLEQVRVLPPYQWAANIKRRWTQKQRERVARVIFRLPPRSVPAPSSNLVSIHILTSRRDWLGALWSVRTFLEFMDESLPVFFHDDGTLTSSIADQLRISLPGATVVFAREAEVEIARRLRDFPLCAAARHRHVMTHKLLDVALLAPSPRYIMLDSDLLFFRNPGEVVQWIKQGERVNLWNSDEGNHCNLTVEEARVRHGVSLFEGMNAGFGCVWRECVDFRLLEDYFSHESVWSHPHRVEQTAYALLSGRFGARLLPRTYLVDSNRAVGLPTGLVMKHYVGKIRDLFFSEGIKHLLAQGFVAVQC